MKSSSYRNGTLIHLFALAHALTATLTRSVGYVDDLPLTLLTISLIVILCIRKGLIPEMMAALTLIGCFSGYFLGTWGGEMIERLTHDETLSAAITTALVTEILGWGVLGFAAIRGREPDHRPGWTPSMSQVLAFAAGILLLRVAYMVIFRSTYFSGEGLRDEFQHLFGNTLSILALCCGNVIFVSLIPRMTKSPAGRNVISASLAVLFSVAVTLLTWYDFPESHGVRFDATGFLRLLAVVLLADIIIFAFFKLTSYALESKHSLSLERDKKHLAQFRYDKLKLQINPHFLFNSLNILDYLVQNGETERAGSFIRKLASIYRYMLKNEEQTLVRLQEEMDFAGKYIDLLHERFADGFLVETDLPDEALSRHVVPCCLQLLIENATKHNVVSPSRPLKVRIGTEGDLLFVSNNLQRRLSEKTSTGIGLSNIRQQYLDLSGKEILIEETETEFTVKLPLL